MAFEVEWLALSITDLSFHLFHAWGVGGIVLGRIVVRKNCGTVFRMLGLPAQVKAAVQFIGYRILISDVWKQRMLMLYNQNNCRVNCLYSIVVTVECSQTLV